jgi:ATPase subunit of ABC transporter with duplicated ATPase domains
LQPIICTLNGVSKRVSQTRTLFAAGVNVAFVKGAKIGMLGPNGIGKSSLLKIIAGTINRRRL